MYVGKKDKLRKKKDSTFKLQLTRCLTGLANVLNGRHLLSVINTAKICYQNNWISNEPWLHIDIWNDTEHFFFWIFLEKSFSIIWLERNSDDLQKIVWNNTLTFKSLMEIFGKSMKSYVCNLKLRQTFLLSCMYVYHRFSSAQWNMIHRLLGKREKRVCTFSVLAPYHLYTISLGLDRSF